MWERGLITQNERDGQLSGVGEREKRKGRGENETEGRGETKHSRMWGTRPEGREIERVREAERWRERRGGGGW